ncbi:MAG: hypothetical protein U0Q16_37950 [Bryobacteraceae bacterium]
MSRLKLLILVLAASAAVASAASLAATLQPGKADLKSAGPIAFGPDGVLFVGDPMGARVFALATNDAKPGKAADPEMKGLEAKIAALLGTSPDQILINDMAVNPVSKRVYLSISRGRGPDAPGVIVRTDASGKLSELALDNIANASVDLPNAPAADKKGRGGVPVRVEAITDLAYVDGKIIVAGLSNEEFSSNLRSIPFPFQGADNGSAIEIYHGNHGRFETNAPVRTFTTYSIANKPHLLAAYTCTPLVKIPMSDLQPGKKVGGVTIAELGNRNRPLDMVVYKKGNANYILMNNSSRGVMKIPVDGIEKLPAITAKVEEKAGMQYETLAELKGVEQLDRFDRDHALMLVKSESGAIELKKLALP